MCHLSLFFFILLLCMFTIMEHIRIIDQSDLNKIMQQILQKFYLTVQAKNLKSHSMHNTLNKGQQHILNIDALNSLNGNKKRSWSLFKERKLPIILCNSPLHPVCTREGHIKETPLLPTSFFMNQEAKSKLPPCIRIYRASITQRRT